MNKRELAWKYIKYIWKEEIYLVITVIYLLKLNQLNKYLLMWGFKDPFALLGYSGWKPVKYFVLASLLFIIGIIIEINGFQRFKEPQNDLAEMILSIIAIIIVPLLLITIIILINNPILKAILAGIAITVSAVYALANAN